MQAPPDLSEAGLTAFLREQYGPAAVRLTFLPLGDVVSAQYRVTTASGDYFLKLRRGEFDENAVRLPAWLRKQGNPHILAALPTLAGHLWARLAAANGTNYTAILYPYVDGHNGFEHPLSEAQWRDFGAALRAIHDGPLPPEVARLLPSETYSPRWRESLAELLARAATDRFDDPEAAGMAALFNAQADVLRHCLDQDAQLSATVQAGPLPNVLCHTDIHGGNLLLDDEHLYIVDWDNPLLAPRERDLMYIGAGIIGTWTSPRESALFYAGYGPVQVNAAALAYYRFNHIVQDMALFGSDLLLGREGGADRARWLRLCQMAFEPGEVVAMAYAAERSMNE
jgi:spectinomycin phosphotransferase